MVEWKGVEPYVAVLRTSLSLIPFSGHCIRATPAVFPAVIRGLPLASNYPVRTHIDSPVRCLPAIQRGLLTIQCSRASICYPFPIFLPRLWFSVMVSRTLPSHSSPSRCAPSSPSRRLCRPAKCCICTTCHRCRSHSRAALPRSASVCSESSPRLRASLLSPGYLPTHWSRSYSLILKICYSHGFFVSLTARSILNTLQR